MPAQPLRANQSLLTLQRAVGNQAVVQRLAHPASQAPVVQRDLFTSYEAAVGKDRPGSEEAAKADYTKAKKDLEAGGARNIKEEVGGALAGILGDVLPSDMASFDASTYRWQEQVDAVFRNVVAFANAHWDYSAGGAGRVPIFLTAKGNCGALATAFHQAVTVMAMELNEPSLKCELRSHAAYLLTPTIQGTMTGKNGPYGNIARQIDSDTGPFDADYAGVRRAHFNGHTWAEVTLPSGGTRVYDLLMNTMGAPVTPTLPNGYRFVKAHDANGTALPSPPGFDAGKFMVAENIYLRAHAVKTEYESFIAVVKRRDLDALPALIDAELERNSASRWLWPDNDLKTKCRAVLRIQALSAGSIELAARFGEVWPAVMANLNAARALPPGKLASVVE